MSTFELIDELEAGELSIEFEGEEPEMLLEWAIDRFSPGLAVSTSFQIDSVVLIDMAYEIDHDHGAIVKLNPLAEWTEDEVWDYVREREVPYHSLYDKGYRSIGCAPCTRAIADVEPSRAGRWWWESNAPKECGIHCSIESGGLEHELHALLKETH